MMEESLEEPPAAFLCPITLQVMNNPTTDQVSGHTFERATILEWIQRGRATNPLTRRPLYAGDLAPNETLKRQIRQWKKEHGMRQETEEEPNEVPFYRRRNPEEQVHTSIPTGNDFFQRLREAQRRDAEFKRRIMSLREPTPTHYNRWD